MHCSATSTSGRCRRRRLCRYLYLCLYSSDLMELSALRRTVSAPCQATLYSCLIRTVSTCHDNLSDCKASQLIGALSLARSRAAPSRRLPREFRRIDMIALQVDEPQRSALQFECDFLRARAPCLVANYRLAASISWSVIIRSSSHRQCMMTR